MNPLVIFIPILFSFHQIFVRLGGREAETFSGIYVSLLTSTLLFLPSIFYPTLEAEFLIYMSLAGVFHFLIARICFYHAISRIGANLSAPLSATRVFFAALLGLFLGESLSLKIVTMSILIFAGVVLISNPGGRADAAGILLGILTGFFSALSSFFVKFGYAVEYNPLFAIFLGFSISSLLLTPFALKKSLRNTNWFVAAGFTVGFAHLLRYVVLKDTPVTVVEPVTSSYPLFTLLLSAIFLKEGEMFSAKSLAGTLLILTGIYIYYLK